MDKLDKDGNALVPGQLYCMVVIKEDQNYEAYESFESLAFYGSDGQLYEADSGDDISHYNFDSLQIQPGAFAPAYSR